MAGAIAMLAVFVVVCIEMFFATRGAGHSHENEWTKVPDDTPSVGLRGGGLPRSEHQMNGHLPLHNLESPAEPSMNGGLSPKPRKPNDNDSDSDLDDLDVFDNLDPMADESAHLSNPSAHKHSRHASHATGHSHRSPEDNPQKLFLQCLLLEAGILFHSIFIGMAVSVTTGTAFVVLLVAICFHQTFEGFASDHELPP